jgi:hypothetical protein
MLAILRSKLPRLYQQPRDWENSRNKRLDSLTLVVEDLNPESDHASEPDLTKGDPFFHLHRGFTPLRMSSGNKKAELEGGIMKNEPVLITSSWLQISR